MPDELSSLEPLSWPLVYPEFCQTTQPFSPWSKRLLAEVNQLAQFILNHPQARDMPEITALGFWCRATNLEPIRQDASALVKSDSKAGNILHIAPANVDTVFFYSTVLSLLAGNRNIVRLSTRSGDITRQLVSLLQSFLQTHTDSVLRYLLAIVEYDAQNRVATASLSRWCDLRVIWGGDQAIQAISGIEPDTQQCCFPDRFSLAIMQLDSEEQIGLVVDRLLSDMLPFAQQACSSPKALFWWQTAKPLQQQFYQQLQTQLVQRKQRFEMADQVEQYLNQQRLLMLGDSQLIHQHPCQGLTILELDKIEADLFDWHSGHGLLLVNQLASLDKLPFADKLQTVSCFGISVADLQKQLDRLPMAQYKRIITQGKALEFQPIWDGIDLCRVFSLLDYK
ncbi:acyl-CoA reductase [Neptunicella sp.]|uniref:acyl-CoA reductase n=1 Tax=Neptunicella sp. TaxID=2125986 RepID=UPI003F6916DD